MANEDNSLFKPKGEEGKKEENGPKDGESATEEGKADGDEKTVGENNKDPFNARNPMA